MFRDLEHDGSDLAARLNCSSCKWKLKILMSLIAQPSASCTIQMASVVLHSDDMLFLNFVSSFFQCNPNLYNDSHARNAHSCFMLL